MYCHTQCLQPCSRPPSTHASAGDSWMFMGMSESVSCGLAPPFSWVLVYTRFCLCPPRVYSPVLCEFWWFYSGVNGNLLQEGLCQTHVCCTQSPCGRPLLTHTSKETLRHSSGSVSGGWVCILCPSQVWEAQATRCLVSTVPGGPCFLITSLVLATWFPGCAARALSQMCCLSPLKSWSQAETLLVDVNHLRKMWLAAGACSQFGGRCPFWGWDCSSPLPSGSGCQKPASLPLGQGRSGTQQASSLLVFAQSFVLWVGQAAP